MLTFVVHKLGDTVLFRCTGRVVRGEGEHLQDAIVSQPHARAIVLDLAEIDRVDAAGLGVLLSVRAWAEARNVDLKLINLTPRVDALIELTNLRSAFEICSLSEMLELLCRAINQPRSELATHIAPSARCEDVDTADQNEIVHLRAEPPVHRH